jgi:hypothetical protein
MNQTFTKDAETQKITHLQKLQNAKKFSDEIQKTLKNMKKHKLRVFQYTDDDQKKYLKKKKCNKCKRNEPAAQKNVI